MNPMTTPEVPRDPNFLSKSLVPLTMPMNNPTRTKPPLSVRNPASLRCSICDITYQSLKGIHLHNLKFHNPDAVWCLICNRPFKKKENFEKHNLTFHSKEANETKEKEKRFPKYEKPNYEALRHKSDLNHPSLLAKEIDWRSTSSSHKKQKTEKMASVTPDQLESLVSQLINASPAQQTFTFEQILQRRQIMLQKPDPKKPETPTFVAPACLEAVSPEKQGTDPKLCEPPKIAMSSSLFKDFFSSLGVDEEEEEETLLSNPTSAASSTFTSPTTSLDNLPNQLTMGASWSTSLASLTSQEPQEFSYLVDNPSEDSDESDIAQYLVDSL